MPMPGAVEPRPLPSLESRSSVPLEAQEASYLAASARILQFSLQLHGLNPFDSTRESPNPQFELTLPGLLALY
jgi:hypothetical protein